MSTSVDVVFSEINTAINRSVEGEFPLHDWLKKPRFQINGDGASLSLTPHEPITLAASFAFDTTRLLLAGRETLLAVQKSRESGNIHAAWSAIQLYYAAYYYVSALFRMIGLANAYLQVQELVAIRNLLNAQGISQLPGTGLYDLEVNPSTTQLVMKKSNLGATHEALWKGLRLYIDDLKGRMFEYEQFSAEELASASTELDAVAKATEGLGSQSNLSAARNDVQYRQKMSCWYPNSRKVRIFHRTDRITQILEKEFVASDTGSEVEYNAFFEKSLTVCGFVHHFALRVSEASPARSPSGRYLKYHTSLV